MLLLSLYGWYLIRCKNVFEIWFNAARNIFQKLTEYKKQIVENADIWMEKTSLRYG